MQSFSLVFVFLVKIETFCITCVGAAISPTELPAINLPAMSIQCEDAVAMNVHPISNGAIENISAGRRPK